MRVLVACEESQAVTIEFRKLGHKAFSCDLEPCSGGHPEWHIQQDVLPLLNGNCEFKTCDGMTHTQHGRWDLLICHPPCTYLTTAATRMYSYRLNPPDKVRERELKREEAFRFFMACVNSDCNKIVVENPQGYTSTMYRKPDQTIHPYMFAEDEGDIDNYQLKRTCLWLKGVKKLQTNNLPKPEPVYYTSTSHKAVYFTDNHGNIGGIKHKNNDASARSKTFHGVAKAMAEQWGKVYQDVETQK